MFRHHVRTCFLPCSYPVALPILSCVIQRFPRGVLLRRSSFQACGPALRAEYMDETTHDVSKRNLYFRAIWLSHNSCRFASCCQTVLCRRAPHCLAPVDLKTRRIQQLVPRSRHCLELSWRHRDDPACACEEQKKIQITASHGQSPFFVLAQITKPCGWLVKSGPS